MHVNLNAVSNPCVKFEMASVEKLNWMLVLRYM